MRSILISQTSSHAVEELEQALQHVFRCLMRSPKLADSHMRGCAIVSKGYDAGLRNLSRWQRLMVSTLEHQPAGGEHDSDFSTERDFKSLTLPDICCVPSMSSSILIASTAVTLPDRHQSTRSHRGRAARRRRLAQSLANLGLQAIDAQTAPPEPIHSVAQSLGHHITPSLTARQARRTGVSSEELRRRWEWR